MEMIDQLSSLLKNIGFTGGVVFGIGLTLTVQVVWKKVTIHKGDLIQQKGISVGEGGAFVGRDFNQNPETKPKKRAARK